MSKRGIDYDAETQEHDCGAGGDDQESQIQEDDCGDSADYQESQMQEDNNCGAGADYQESQMEEDDCVAGADDQESQMQEDDCVTGADDQESQMQEEGNSTDDTSIIIVPPEPIRQIFQIGDNVLARWAPRQWYLAHVTSFVRGRYSVYFMDGNVKINMRADSIRPFDSPNPPPGRGDMIDKVFFYEGDAKLAQGR